MRIRSHSFDGDMADSGRRSPRTDSADRRHASATGSLGLQQLHQAIGVCRACDCQDHQVMESVTGGNQSRTVE